MAETRKQPGLFTADLFSSPPSQSAGQSPASGGLSFGLGSDVFSSPFSLAPAMASTQTRKEEVSSALSDSPARPEPSRSPVVPRAVSPAITTTHPSSVVMSTSSIAELSNVPLDSPPPSSENTPAATGGGLSSHTTITPHRPPPTAHHPPVGPGWNDPPHSSSATAAGSVPVSDMATPDMYPLQPLAGQPDTPQPTPTAPPPAGSAAPVQSQGNPYRLGQGGGKRVAYGTSVVPSYATPPTQPLQQAPPTSLPSSVSHPPDMAQVDMAAMPAQQEVGVVLSEGVVQQLRYHWFYLRPNERYWIPFSLSDSASLEHSWSSDPAHQVLVATDGGRYDVDLHARSRSAIYWSEPVSEVRRCCWFYKGDTDRWYMPYTEDVATKLEEAYMSAMRSGVWGGKVEVGEGEGVVLHSQSSMAHYPASQFQPITHDVDYTHPRSVLRGFAEIDHVEQGEQSRIDHLVFVVHGIGQYHDLSFRCLVDCVDDFREVSQLMLRTHQFEGQASRAGDTGGRVEFLPVHWHAALHGDGMGVDDQLQKLSLRSISRLRGFTNSTLLDILFFTSPVYFQTIIDQVAGEMNRMYRLFRERNPGFSGGVSVIGHSLGSCILFDILSHQTGTGVDGFSSTDGDNAQCVFSAQCGEMVLGEEAEGDEEKEEGEDDTPTSLESALSYLGLADLTEVFEKEQIDFDSLLMISNEDLKELGIPMGPRKKLSSFISTQGEKIRAAKERKARAEAERKLREKALSKEQEEASRRHARLQGVKYVKGEIGTGQPLVAFPQLHFKTEHLFALGSPIGLFLIVRGVEELGPEYKLPHCHHIFNIFHPFDPVAYRLEPLVCESPPEKPVLMPHHKGRKRFHLELYETVEQVGASMKQYVVEGMRNMWQQLNELARSHRTEEQGQVMGTEEPDTPTTIVESEVTVPEKELSVGSLNGGRRVDYVLQEKPIEKLNEYLFALSSHLSYWRSEDTALFILKEVYGEMNPELIKS